MRRSILLALFLVLSLQAFSQLTTAQPGLPKDPQAILAAAAPYYDFSDPALKPWHLKATYQFFDENSHSTEDGTYEYWWASPKASRSTWTREGASYTEWHTADGKFAYEKQGGPISIFERSLPLFLFLRLPDAAAIDPDTVRIDSDTIKVAGMRFDHDTIKATSTHLPCVVQTPIPQGYPGKTYYCFDPRMPAVTAVANTGPINAEFSHIVKMQGRFLPREITLLYAGVPVLTVSVEAVKSFEPSDRVITPSAGASVEKFDRVQASPAVAWDRIIGKVIPTISPGARRLPQNTGLVLLDVIVGVDGNVQDVQIASAPNALLGGVCQDAVSAWKFKPYLQDGIPAEMETSILFAF
jgi:hypothetical protein